MADGQEEQIIQLKRLLVTMKQKFEQTLQQLNQQIQNETAQKKSLHQELEIARKEFQELKQRHDEEYDSLIQQQIHLKDLLQKTQSESEEKIKIWQEGFFQKTQGEESNLNLSPAMLRRLETLEEKVRQQSGLQEKYEQIKDEFSKASRELEEALEARLLAEKKVDEQMLVIEHQKNCLDENDSLIKTLQEGKEKIEAELIESRTSFNDCETRLKTAQQHLAKKVKEAALQTEQNDGLQLHLMDLERTLTETKRHAEELQTKLDNSIKQEKKLQEQLHESLKSNENQASKWEEKYFRMYDKWQESELQVRELKKLEEKHQQMQNLLANLGSFMGTSSNVTPQTIEKEESLSLQE